MMLGVEAAAGEYWLALDVDAPSEQRKIHLEVPYVWLDLVQLEGKDMEKAALDKVAKTLDEGQKKPIFDATQGEERVRVSLAHRPDGTGPLAKTFFVSSSSGEKNMEVPLEMVVQIAPMAAALTGETGAVDLGKMLGKLDQMRPFTLMVVEERGERVEIGVR